MKIPFESRPAKSRKLPPFPFILEALAPLTPTTRLMFGCLAIYVEAKIVLILRDKADSSPNNGVWFSTTPAHHASLRPEFPHMRPVYMRDKELKGWQILAADSPDFEGAALRVCRLITEHDPRIGKIPKPKRPRA